MGDNLAGVLERLQLAGNIDLAAVVSTDGFLIESAAAQGSADGLPDAEEFASVAINGLMVARALGREIERGEITDALLEYERGTVMIQALDDEIALVLLASHDVNLGRLRLLARRYREEIVAAAGVALR